MMTEPSKSYKLSEEQLRFYKENGYLVIKQLVDFSSLYSYKQRFLQICKGIVTPGNITVVKERQLMKNSANPEDYVNKIQELLYDDVFIQYAQQPAMLDVLTQLIGEDITAINSMFINKPPGTGRHPSHQDLFYFPYRPADMIIGSWTAIDDVHLDNGCLYVIPGSHKAEVLYEHGDVKDAKKLYHGIIHEEEIASLEKRVYLEMSPGDTVFFHPYLVHGSGPNVSKSYRKAITFHYANSKCYSIDVTNTVQQGAAREIEAEAKRRGFDITFNEIWKYKSRHITGKSKL